MELPRDFWARLADQEDEIAALRAKAKAWQAMVVEKNEEITRLRDEIDRLIANNLPAD